MALPLLHALYENVLDVPLRVLLIFAADSHVYEHTTSGINELQNRYKSRYTLELVWIVYGQETGIDETGTAVSAMCNVKLVEGEVR